MSRDRRQPVVEPDTVSRTGKPPLMRTRDGDGFRDAGPMSQREQHQTLLPRRAEVGPLGQYAEGRLSSARKGL